ncbi:MAG: NADH-quinone oxidoreductase subunit C [Acidobacteriota bacterium]
MTDEIKAPGPPEPPPQEAGGDAAPVEKPAAAKPAAPKAPAAPKKWEPTGEVVLNAPAQALAERFGESVRGVKSPCGEAGVLVDKARLVEILTFLRDDPGCAMNYLSDLTGAHYPINDKKFEVVYHLYSLEKGHSLRVKVQLEDGEPCPTATGVWPGADWMEREAHDMLGIVFEGHPNLKVILLPDDFEGHPLRKEFPLGGAQEEMIRSNRYGKPVYLPDDVEEARKIVEEQRHGR